MSDLLNVIRKLLRRSATLRPLVYRLRERFGVGASPIERHRAQYRRRLRAVARTVRAHEFPGGILTPEGDFYLGLHDGLFVFYNFNDLGLTLGDGQSLDTPAGQDVGAVERFVMQAVPPDGVYIDVGANNGYFYALKVAYANSAARVYAFEPDPAILQHLRRNVSFNRLEGRIDVVPSAVSDTTGQARLTAGRGASGFLVTDADATPTVTVDTTTIDEFVAARELPRVDLLKIDIEGGEHRCLRGAQATLRAHRPALVIEVDEDNLARAGTSTEAVLRFLTEMNYLAYRVRGTRDVLAVPPDRAPMLPERDALSVIAP